MSTIRQQLLTAMETRLNTGRPAGVPQVERSRAVDVDPEQLPSLVMNWVAATPRTNLQQVRREPAEDVVCRRVLSVRFASRAAGGGGQTAEQNAEVMAAWVVKQLCGVVSDASPFYHLAHRIDLGGEACSFSHGAPGQCLVDVELIVDYGHLVSDAEAWG